MPKRPKKHFKGLRRASPALANRFDHSQPIAKIDTRPMAILAVIIFACAILTVQIPQHALVVEFWNSPALDRNEVTSENVNRLTTTDQGEMLWNGQRVSQWQLMTMLEEVRLSETLSVVEYEPDPNASYDLSVKVLAILRMTDTRFRIAGMEKYCRFDSGDARFATNGQNTNLSLALSLSIHDSDDLNAWREREPCEPLSAQHSWLN